MITEIKIGQYEKLSENSKVSFDYARSFLSICDTQTFEVAATVLENIVLQIIDTLPSNHVRLELFENIPSHNFSWIKNFFSETENGIGKLSLTTREMIDVIENIEIELQKRYALFASANVKTIEEYNNTSKQGMDYRIVIISGLASLFMQNNQILFKLRTLFQQGTHAGVLLMVHHNIDSTRKIGLTEQNLEFFYKFMVEMKESFIGVNFLADVIPFNNHPAYQKDILELGYKAEFEADFASNLSNSILEKRKLLQASNPLQDFIKIKIGKAGAKEAFFAMGDATHTYHAMISGANGSGKTSFIQNVLLHICEEYSPMDISLLILDFGGNTFHPYSDIEHVAYVFDEPQNGAKAKNVFEYMKYELARRKELFTSAGRKHKETIESLAEYKHYEHETIPRLLILIDEFGTLMANSEVKNIAAAIINNISREGRKFGMHLCLINQSFSSVDMPTDIKVNASMRIALRANNPRDSYATLENNNEAAYHIQNFQAVLNNDAGRGPANLIVQLEDVKETIKERRTKLKEISPKKHLSDIEIFLQNNENTPSQPNSLDTGPKSPSF